MCDGLTAHPPLVNLRLIVIYVTVHKSITHFIVYIQWEVGLGQRTRPLGAGSWTGAASATAIVLIFVDDLLTDYLWRFSDYLSPTYVHVIFPRFLHGCDAKPKPFSVEVGPSKEP